MRAYWEDPFGEIEIFDPVREQRKGLFRTAAGVIVMRDHVDLSQIKQEQKRLVPFFTSLYEAAQDCLDHAAQAGLATRIFTFYSHTIYRAPDAPRKICELPLESAGRPVVLGVDGKIAHPLIEDLFPSKPFGALSDEARYGYALTEQVKANTLHVDLVEIPAAVRIVVPEIIHHILHWIGNIYSPIAAFDYCVRPAERVHVRHQRFGARVR